MKFLDQLPGKAHAQTKHDWPAIVAECKRHPGKWAEVLKLGPNTTMSYYQTRLRAMGLEAATRRVDGHQVLYGRWPK